MFVHCQAGISRSATICLAYLMRTNRVKLDEAFEFVKQRRSIISPNFSFMGQLLQFESQVLAPHCSAEAGSPAMAVLDRSTSTTTVFNFPVSIPVHSTNSALSYLQSPITTSPSCWKATGGDLQPRWDSRLLEEKCSNSGEGLLRAGPYLFNFTPSSTGFLSSHSDDVASRCLLNSAHLGPIYSGYIKSLWQKGAGKKGLIVWASFFLLAPVFCRNSSCLTYLPVLSFLTTHTYENIPYLFLCRCSAFTNVHVYF